MDRATVERLRAHDWGADPFEPPRAPGEPYRIKLVDGRCFFLDRENRCRIHSQLSYEAKPAVCRSFPLTVLEVAGRQHARLSFWCPTVTANAGRALEHQSRWLKESAKRADRRTSPLKINEKVVISLRDFERVHQALRRFLLAEAPPIGDRLAAGSALIRRLDEATKNGIGDVERIVGDAESAGVAALAVETRGRGHASGGSRMLWLYLLQDRQAGRLSMFVRFLSVLLFRAGVAPLQCRALQARTSLRRLRRAAFDLSPVSNELLTRYLCSKLDSRRYVAGDATLVEGFNLLTAAYGMINLWARMKAASDDRLYCSDEDVQSAVRTADLLIVEHRGPIGRRFDVMLTKAVLGSSDLCGDVLVYFEGKR